MSTFANQAVQMVRDRYDNAIASLDFDPGWAADVNDRILVVELHEAAELHDQMIRDGRHEDAAAAYGILMEIAEEIAQRSREKKRSGWGFTLHQKGILGAYAVKVPARARDDAKWAAHEAKRQAREAKSGKALTSLARQLKALDPEQLAALVAAVQAA